MEPVTVGETPPHVIEKLKELKNKVYAESEYKGFTDMMFTRFLRGHKGIVDNAARFMIATGKFRIDESADTIVVDDFKAFNDRKVSFVGGYDKNGRPIANCLPHRHDPNSRDIIEVKKFIIYTIDNTLKLAKPDEEKISYLFDLSKFGMKNMDFEALKLLVTILQSHYPETLGQAYIVNAPFFFGALWRVIRSWLDPVTAEKVQFISPKEIEKYIDLEELADDMRESLSLPPRKNSAESGLSTKQSVTNGPLEYNDEAELIAESIDMLNKIKVELDDAQSAISYNAGDSEELES